MDRTRKGENRVYVYGRISGGEESGLVHLYTASSIEHEERRGLRRGIGREMEIWRDGEEKRARDLDDETVVI